MQKRLRYWRCSIAILLLGLTLWGPALAQDVRPGVGVGRVRLGMTSTQVRRAIGKPDRTGVRAPGVREETWAAKAPVEWMREYFLTVLYERGRVVQIEFNAPRYTTANGLSVLKTLAEFRRKYPKAARREYAHIDPEGGGYRSVIYDATDAGIAFSLGGQDELLDTYKPSEIRIHRRGRRAIPDPNAKRDDPPKP